MAESGNTKSGEVKDISPIFVIQQRVIKSGCTASDYVFHRNNDGKVWKGTTFKEAKKKAKEVCGSIYKLKPFSYGGINRFENLEHCGSYDGWGKWTP